MRRFPTPFISYTYRALPLLAEAAVKRPWKYAKWAGLSYGLNEVGKGKVPFAEYFSDDPDFGRFKEEVGNEEAERLLMRENLRNKLFGLPFMPDTLIKLPFASGRDKETPLYLDVRRFIPGGDVFAVGDKGIGIPIGFGKSLKLPEVITPNFGAPGEVFFPLLTGVDPFTLQKIDGLGLGNDEKVKMQHILGRLIPNIPTTAFTAPLFGEDSKVVKYDPFSQSFGSQKILKAMRQMQDPENLKSKYGADFTPFEAILSTFGFKLQPQQFTKLIGIKQQEFKSLYSSARQSFYRISKQYAEGKISKEEAEERVNELYKVLERGKIKSEVLTKQLKEAREKKYDGGEVEDVAQVKEEPEDRINPITNEPYSVTSGVKKPEEIEIESEKRQEFKFGKLVKGAIKAFHGSPHDFKKFDIEKMGTGEGFQVFGKGLYFTDTEKVAQTYKKNKDGKIYKVKLNVSEDDLIDYDKSIGSQSKNHQKSLSKIIDDLEVEDLIYFRNSSSIDTDDWIDISRYYDKDNDMFREAIKDVILEEGNNVKDFLKIVNEIKGAGKAEEFLKSYNIQGIKYKDGLTRAAKEGTPVSKNYVIFDPRVIEISKKYGVAIPVAGAMLKEYDKEPRQELDSGGQPQSSKVLDWITKNRGEMIAKALVKHSADVAEIESRNNPKAIQKIKRDGEFVDDGPGRGKYQYETSKGSGANKTAITRYKEFYKNNNLKIPKQYQVLLGKNDVDFSKLPEALQDDIFYADKNQGLIPLGDLASGKLSSKEAWLKYHWAGKEEDRPGKEKMWDERFKDLINR